MKNQKKRPDLKEEIRIPEGATADIDGGHIIIKKDGLELKRKLNNMIDIKIEGDKIILEAKKSTKKEKKIFGSFNAHVRNMTRGINTSFKYKLQAVSVHFPMNVSLDKEKNELVVKNFLGEKTDRRIKLIKGANVKVEKDTIEVESADKELAGQCAANIEKGTKVRNRDRRVYQDGIYIIEKPGRGAL